MLLFLSRDERARPAWQSGVHYVDGTPKSSKRARHARRSTAPPAARSRAARASQLPVRTTYLRFGTRSAAKRGVFRVSFRCDLDCRYRVRLENAVTHVDEARGDAARPRSASSSQVDLGSRSPRPGTYRYTIRLVHPVNPAPPTVRQGPSFALP